MWSQYPSLLRIIESYEEISGAGQEFNELMHEITEECDRIRAPKPSKRQIQVYPSISV